MSLQNFNISFDPYGSLYFSNATHTYQISVDGRNNLILDKEDYTIFNEYSQTIYKIQNLDEKSLKERLKQKEEDNELENNNEYNSDEDGIEHDYYPEDNDYIPIDEPLHDSDNEVDTIVPEYDYGEQNVKFVFWSSEFTDQIKIYYRKNGDITALYDTYIYNVDNKLIFKSNSSDDSAIYRIRIYPDGHIYFRPIGHQEKKYNLKVIDNEIILVYVSC